MTGPGSVWLSGAHAHDHNAIRPAQGLSHRGREDGGLLLLMVPRCFSTKTAAASWREGLFQMHLQQNPFDLL